MCYRLPGCNALVCVGCVAVCVLQTAGPQCPGVWGVCSCVCVYRLAGCSAPVCVGCVAVCVLQTAGPQCPGVGGVSSCVCVTDCWAAVPWCVWGV